MAKKIYLADDEQDIREILTEFLSNAGYEVTAYKNGDTLFSAFQEKPKPCDLVILDIMMPGSDGLSICKKLRTISSVPIIILTAKDSESDHMKGFMYGGDDYLIKPFSPSLLVVRVNALFRRVEMNIPVKADISFGDVCFSWEKHNAIVKEHDIGLTMTEFSLLGCLMEHGGTAIPRNEILDKVWGIDSTEIETRVVDETVRRVRQKMKTAGSKVRISAVWGYGYKLENCNE
jgi:DNA-binding response OmpR family regulator